MLPIVATLICLQGVRAEDGTAIWLDQPAFDNQLQFLGVEQQQEGDQRFQRFRFTSSSDFQKCRVEARLPEMLCVDEFVAQARVNSTHAGVRLALRLVLPRQIDPETDLPLRTWIYGNRLERESEWQMLSVALTESNIEAELRNVRTRLAPHRVDASDMYIDRCALLAEFSRGDCVIDAESVTYGPIALRPEADDQGLRLAAEPAGEKRVSRLRVERNQVFLDDEPSLLVMIPDHGESMQQIRKLGVNTLWTHDYEARDRLKMLSEAGLVIAATPPHPQFDPADFRRPLTGLIPLERQMDLVDLVYLGTGWPPQQFPHLLAWARHVRSADRRLHRPIMADVIGSEGLASRQIDMVGIGVLALHRNMTFGEQRNRIRHKIRRASQMTLPWRWVQTESPTDMTKWRARVGLSPLVVEPEQITMQVVAALSSGVRAIGFWKRRPFADGQLEESETGLAVALNSVYLNLLEPWLVAGQTQSYIAVNDGRIGQRTGQNASERLREAVQARPVSLNPGESEIPRTPDAAVITGQNGSLIIVAAWDDSSQFVPGHLYARHAQLIATARETSSASLVTGTQVIGQRHLKRPGGLEVTIDELDQFGIVLVSSDPGVFANMRRRVYQARPQVAELQLKLARLKHQRVQETCAEIDQLGVPVPPSASTGLKNASRMLQSAETALENSQFADADRRARGCLRALRAVQNLYWKTAIQQLPTPMASPYTVAFSALPEHWKMMATIEATAASDNLLPTGRAARLPELEQAGWSFPKLDGDIYSTRPALQYESQSGTRYLQLAAWKPESTQAALSTQPSMLVSCPVVEVEAGDIVEIRGRVRRNNRTIRSIEEYPFMIFDSDLGPVSAVRPALESSWRSFHMYRQVSRSGPLQITFGLQGSAEVHVDLDALTVRKVGRAESSVTPFRTATGSRDKGAGHSFFSSD